MNFKKTALSSNVYLKLMEMRGQDGKPEFIGGTDICVCPQCGLEVGHQRGIPCNELTCTKCNIPLTGKGVPGETTIKENVDFSGEVQDIVLKD